MIFLRQISQKLRFLIRRKSVEDEMTEEMRFHLEMRKEGKMNDGLSADDAEYAAHRSFGSVTQIQEEARESMAWIWLEQAVQDSRYAIRQLSKAPRFSAIIVITLALSIGAATSVFNVARDVFLRSLPVQRPEELVLFDCFVPPNASRGNTWSLGGPTFSFLTFEQMRDHNASLSSIFAFARIPQLRVSSGGTTDGECEGLLVSSDFFRGLGVPVSLGRPISAEDDLPESAPVAVITNNYWQRRFAGSTAVLGKAVLVNGTPVSIIGVTAPEFTGMQSKSTTLDFIFPLHLEPRLRTEFSLLSQPSGTLWWLTVMGRMQPGVSMDQVHAELATIFQQSAAEGLKTLGRLKTADGKPRGLPELRVGPGGQGMAPALWQHERGLLIALSLVGLVLLIACTNVANLLLSRGLARQREIAVRLALGAKRSRLVRQLLTESLVLAGLGGIGGVVLSYWGKNLLWPSSSVNLSLLSFSTGISVLTALLFGLVPALRTTRLDLTAEFQGGGRHSLGGGRSSRRLGSVLIIGQVALSCVLLIGTSLLTRTLVNLRTLDFGINRHELLLFRIDATHAGYGADKFADLHRLLAERIAAVPGAQAVTFSRMPWLSGTRHGEHFVADGIDPLPGQPDDAIVHAVAPGFFETMQMSMVLGRSFTSRDDAGAPKVAIINETLARIYFGSTDPIGRRFGFRDNPGPFEIIGVVHDALDFVPQSGAPSLVFLPINQAPIGATGGSVGVVNFAVRTSAAVLGMTSSVRTAVQSVDANLPMLEVRTQEEQMENLITNERTLARLSIFFGAFTLMLTCIGFYGLISYTVERRTNEIGLRMALGARPETILSMILGGALRLGVIGAAIGVIIGYSANQLVASLLFGVTSTDIPTYCGVVLTLLTATSVASGFPALRATNVDPAIALRAE